MTILTLIKYGFGFPLNTDVDSKRMCPSARSMCSYRLNLAPCGKDFVVVGWGLASDCGW
jgi:hypothetical protein